MASTSTNNVSGRSDRITKRIIRISSTAYRITKHAHYCTGTSLSQWQIESWGPLQHTERRLHTAFIVTHAVKIHNVDENLSNR